MAAGSVPAIDSLPPELLETIFGLLDVRTLCTVRLVCTHFRSAASWCLHSVQLSVENLRSRPGTTLSNFPNLSRVTFVDVSEDDLLMLAQSPLADAVTHVRAAKLPRQVLRHGQIGVCSPLPLPNLVSLTVSHAAGRAFLFPQTLRELILKGPVAGQTANLVTKLMNLTCLRIDVSGLHSAFEAVTALTALQRLDICCDLTFAPRVAELTLLTHLQFREMWRWGKPSDTALASLSRLQKLVHLGVAHLSTSLGALTSLRSLDLELFKRHRSASETVCMTPFSQLTALKLSSFDFFSASLFPRFNLERLQDLSLSPGLVFNWEQAMALRQATGLTHLMLWKLGENLGPEGFGAALACMSRLQALDLGTTEAFQAAFCCQAIGLLTELTRLEWRGVGVSTRADMEMCLGLKKLRVLRISVLGNTAAAPSDRITPETVFAVAKLPELCRLDITTSRGILGGALTDNVRAWLNAERHDKGWPPLELNEYSDIAKP